MRGETLADESRSCPLIELWWIVLPVPFRLLVHVDH